MSTKASVFEKAAGQFDRLVSGKKKKTPPKTFAEFATEPAAKCKSQGAGSGTVP